MTNDFQLFPDAGAGDDAEQDTDVALVTAYLARELSLVQIVAVEERLANDAEFRTKATAVIDGWTLPGITGVRGARAFATTLTPEEIEAGWQRRGAAPRAFVPRAAIMAEHHPTGDSPPVTRRMLVRIAAVIALIVLPPIAFAQAVLYAADRPDVPGHVLAKRLVGIFRAEQTIPTSGIALRDTPITAPLATLPATIAPKQASGQGRGYGEDTATRPVVTPVIPSAPFAPLVTQGIVPTLKVEEVGRLVSKAAGPMFGGGGVIAMPDGGVLFGRTREQSIMRVGPDGRVMWQYALSGLPFGTATSGDTIAVQVGQVGSGSFEIVLLRAGDGRPFGTRSYALDPSQMGQLVGRLGSAWALQVAPRSTRDTPPPVVLEVVEGTGRRRVAEWSNPAYQVGRLSIQGNALPSIAVPGSARFYRTTGTDTSIGIYDASGSAVGVVPLPRPWFPMTAALLDSLVSEDVRALNARGGAAPVSESAVRAAYAALDLRIAPTTRLLYASPSGDLMVERPDLTRAIARADSAVWDVLAPDGRWRGRLMLPRQGLIGFTGTEFFMPGAPSDPQICGGATSECRAIDLVRYRIVPR
jgi:hypothetical protein